MNKLLTGLTLALIASPALAAEGPFVSLKNTDFIVFLAFLLFLAVLVYFKVPGMLSKLLDDRAAQIRADLDEAKALREEAQTLLASYERKQKEVQEQAGRIVAAARDEAGRAAELAKAEIEKSVQRRLAAAEDQIASAQAAAIRDVRDRAVSVAVAAAADVIASGMKAADGNKLIDDAISTVDAKLH